MDQNQPFELLEQLEKEIDSVSSTIREIETAVAEADLEYLVETVKAHSEQFEELEKELAELSTNAPSSIDLEYLESSMRDDLEELRNDFADITREIIGEKFPELEDLARSFKEDLELTCSELTDIRTEISEDIEERFQEKLEAHESALLTLAEAFENMQDRLDDLASNSGFRLHSDSIARPSETTRRQVGFWLVVIGAAINVIFLMREWQFYAETDNELAGQLVFFAVGTSALAIGSALSSREY